MTNVKPLRWKVASPVSREKLKKRVNLTPSPARDLWLEHADWFIQNCVDAFGLRDPGTPSRKRLATRWREIASETSVESLMKWFYASTFSYVCRQEFPESPVPSLPDPLKLLKLMWGLGKSGRFLRTFLHLQRSRFVKGSASQRLRAVQVASTIANFKKGSPCPSQDAVDAAQLKHGKGIGSRNSHTPTTVSEETLRRSVREVVREVYGGRRFHGSGPAPFPSLSGHFDSSRRVGGASAIVKGLLPRPESGTRELQLMRYHPRTGVWSLYYAYRSQTADQLWWKPRSYRCKPSFILEPLKVRAVTAGPSAEYWMMMPLQKFLWRVLKDHPTFKLISQPISADVLNERLLPRREPGSQFSSGDYSAATDNLKQHLSRYAFDSICELTGVPSWMRRIGSKCLVGHEVHYGKGPLQGQIVRQWNGQLMGSPLSFPILCVVNAAICKTAFETGGDWSDEPKKLRDLPLLVNGDDCVMLYTPSQQAEWKRLAAEAGMAPSIGKCYYSSRFLQMNSVNFILEKGRLVEVPYINFSLCNPVKAKGGEARHWSQVGAAAREFVKGFPETEQRRLVQIFLRRQRPLLAKAPAEISWWLPECLGGLGIPWLMEGPPQCTYRQLQLATYLRGRIEDGEAPMRRPEVAMVPAFIKRAMRSATSWEVKVTDELRAKWEREGGERELVEHVGHGPHVNVVANYNPWMWRSLGTCEESDLRLLPLDDLQGHKGWYSAWKLSKVQCYWARDATELYNYKPPEFFLPGGISEHFSHVFPQVPRRFVRSLTDAFEGWRDGPTQVGFLNSLTEEGEED